MLAMTEAARPRSPVDIIAESFVNFLSGKPINRDATLEAAENIYDQWRGGIGADYRPDVSAGESESSAHRRARNGQQRQTWGDVFSRDGARQATPQQDPEEVARVRAQLAARQVMGFAAAQKLTADDIKDRKRRLAKQHHPDRGGSAAKMAAVNDAADVLLAAL